MADEALVEQDRAQILVARELDAVHVVHFALHVARRTVVPGERRHDRALRRHAQLEPDALVVAAAVEVIDDVEARRALRVVDRGDIEEQREVEPVAQPGDEREQLVGAQLEHGHPEALPRPLDQRAELALDRLVRQRRAPGHVWLGGTRSAAGKIGKILFACEGSRPRCSAARIGW